MDEYLGEVADFSAQAVVNTYLRKHFPEDPIVGEEDSKDLRGDAGKPLREKVHELTNGVFSESEKLTEDKVRSVLHFLRHSKVCRLITVL